MADSSVLKSIEGTATPDYQDSVLGVYEVTYDSVPTNFFTALARAQAATGTPVPTRRAFYGNNLYVGGIQGRQAGTRTLWQWSVTFAPPPQAELLSFQYENPLLRPVVYNVEYMDREYVIKTAKNVDAMSHGDGNGGNRAANTSGAVTNSAGEKPDEPPVDTERLEVLVISKNYAALSDIVTRNRSFKRTTNSDSLIGYTARQLRYLLTTSEGIRYENGIEYWPGTTTILAEDTTDLILDNVGFKYWDGAKIAEVMVQDVDGTWVRPSFPVNLALDGTKAVATQVTYRHLTSTAYASLIT